MRENYKAWEIDFSAFDSCRNLEEKLGFFVKFAVLAPSGHNAQPWKFIINKNTIRIEPDFNRGLPLSDIKHRQLFIALGCALENLIIAADYYNFITAATYMSDGHTAALVEFTEKKIKENQENHLALFIPQRHTNRGQYTDKLPQPEFFSRLYTENDTDIRLDLFYDDAARQRLAALSLEAISTAFGEDGFRQELSAYLKSNFTNSKIGMPGFCFGMPALVSFIAPQLVRHVNVARLSRKKDAVTFGATPVFGLISAAKDERIYWIKTGMLYEKISLEACRIGAATAPLAAAIQHGEFYKNLMKLSNSSLRPQFLFRLGYPLAKGQISPRMASAEVTTFSI